MAEHGRQAGSQFFMQDIINRIKELKSRFDKARPIIGIDKKRSALIELQEKMSRPEFWQNQDEAKKTSQSASETEKEIGDWEKMRKEINDLLEISEIDKDDQSVDLRQEADKQFKILEDRFSKMEFDLMFQGKYDASDTIVAIHAGAGGTDAQDWAEMLLRMYLRFCEKKGWQTKIVSLSAGSEAGIKSVLFEVLGRQSYGNLKSESGVHRLVRISPFDAEKMRHTSFALVEILPLLDEVSEIEIKPEDLRVDVFRAGGHGGQSVNTTDSAVRITHLLTNIVVSCQNERSQAQNRETALKILKSKLQKYYETEVEEERLRLRGEYTEAAWGNQARSYVLQPYKMVKDHRTGFETSDVDKVLDGDLTEVIEAYLRKEVDKKRGI
ncbi:MAG: peptide chain release factor 2 [Parcubacteria group bacterium]